MAFIDDLPQAEFQGQEEADWRKDIEEEEDDDAPASEDLIEMIGFDPDDIEDVSTDSPIEVVLAELQDIKKRIAELEGK